MRKKAHIIAAIASTSLHQISHGVTTLLWLTIQIFKIVAREIWSRLTSKKDAADSSTRPTSSP